MNFITKPDFDDFPVNKFHDMDVEVFERSRVTGLMVGSENARRSHLERVAYDHTTLLRKLVDHSKVSPKKS